MRVVTVKKDDKLFKAGTKLAVPTQCYVVGRGAKTHREARAMCKSTGRDSKRWRCNVAEVYGDATINSRHVRYLAVACRRRPSSKRLSRGRLGIGTALLGAGAGYLVGKVTK